MNRCLMNTSYIECVEINNKLDGYLIVVLNKTILTIYINYKLCLIITYHVNVFIVVEHILI